MEQLRRAKEPVSGHESRGGSSISTSLLARVKRDDGEGWRQIVELFAPKVYAWCRQAGLQPADAADVGQEVLQAVFGRISVFRRDRPGDTFRGWLWRITQHKLKDHWRKTAKQPIACGGSSVREQLARLAESDSSFHQRHESDDDRDIALKVLEWLRCEFESRTWRACWMVVVEGHSADEVAKALEMSRGAVYVAKSRVLRRLREELEGLIEIDLP